MFLRLRRVRHRRVRARVRVPSPTCGGRDSGSELCEEGKAIHLPSRSCIVLLANDRQMNVAALLGYSVTMIALKISLCFFFIKIFASKRPFVMAMIMSTLMSSVVRLACVLVMTIKPCTLESFFFADIIECRGHPPSTPWSIMLDISTVANVLSDLLYCGLSAFAIASMTMRLRNKITSIVLCTLGTLGTIAAVIRAGIQLGHLHGESKFGATQLEVQWSVIELGFGITAASCATLRPLMDRVFRWINGKLGIVSSSVVPSVANPTVGSSRNGGVRGSSHRSAQLGSLVEELDVEDGEGEANKEKKSGGMVSFAAIAVDEVDGDGQPVYRTLSGP